MTITSVEVSCKSCGAVFRGEDARAIVNAQPPVCVFCSGRTFKIGMGVEDHAGPIHERARIKVKDPSKRSREKIRVEVFVGDDLMKTTGRWMRKHRRTDRDADHYVETVTDPATGEVIHYCNEPLSQHQGHGSAKRVAAPASAPVAPSTMAVAPVAVTLGGTLGSTMTPTQPAPPDDAKAVKV